MEMKVLELFAGIGGFSVGLERVGGFKTVAFCEIDKHARKVLQKNWPGVPIYEDVKEVTYERLKADGNVPDVITGGFPCQDISTAGRGAGLAGERSGLWFEFARIIKEVRPRWVIAENVSALRSRGLDQVLRSLSEIGYDAEWHCIPASAVGAPHQRDRIWIVAYPNSKCWPSMRGEREVAASEGLEWGSDGGGGQWHVERKVTISGSREDSNDVGYPSVARCEAQRDGSIWSGDVRQAVISSRSHTTKSNVAYPSDNGIDRRLGFQENDTKEFGQRGFDTGGGIRDEQYANVAHANSPQCERGGLSSRILTEDTDLGSGSWWEIEPPVGRVADGFPGRTHRLKQLGNAVVPMIPELIGRAIMNRKATEKEREQ